MRRLRWQEEEYLVFKLLLLSFYFKIQKYRIFIYTFGDVDDADEDDDEKMMVVENIF